MFEDYSTQASFTSNSTLLDQQFAFTKKTLDPIHDFIVFSSDIWSIIDTPEFQRLRDIKQLGASNFVFPAANHTRFEHCLGTGHLAQKLIKTIYKHQPNIHQASDSSEYIDTIKKNVTLAGLLHDLGHGPFSHLFDGKIITKLCPGSDWSHEKGSAMLLDKLIEDNHIDIEQENKRMIADLILGDRHQPKYQDKMWIFDIVANGRNSIDVDKYDYITRDSYHLGLKDTYIDYRALIKESRVINNEICYPAKTAHQVYELFQVRYKLYKNIYHNRAAKGIELMIAEALFNANSYYNFGECIGNPEEYMRLTDYILKEIELSKTPELEKSRKILERLKRRDIFKFVAEAIVDNSTFRFDEERMKVDIISLAKPDSSENILQLSDFHITKLTNTFGFKDKNPVDCVNFYNKKDISVSFHVKKNEISLLLPEKFSETIIRIYTTDSKKGHIVREAFSRYCEKFLQTKIGPVESNNPPEINVRFKRGVSDDPSHSVQFNQIKKSTSSPAEEILSTSSKASQF